MNTTSKHISVKYHWFRDHAGKKFVISENRVRKPEDRYFHQSFTRWIVCQYWEVYMWLIHIKTTVSVSINGIFSLKWKNYGPKGDI